MTEISGGSTSKSGSESATTSVASTVESGESSVTSATADAFSSQARAVPDSEQQLAEQQAKHVAGEGACIKPSDLAEGAVLAKERFPGGAPQTALSEQAIGRIDYYSSVADKLTDRDFGDVFDGREKYRAAGGNPEAIEEAVRIYAQSPTGQQVLGNLVQSGEALNIYAQPNTRSAGISGNEIHFNGSSPFPALTIAHEMGHTRFGGSHCDYQTQNAICGAGSSQNVEDHENAFREWLGMPLRECYLETNPAHPEFGSRFDRFGERL